MSTVKNDRVRRSSPAGRARGRSNPTGMKLRHSIQILRGMRTVPARCVATISQESASPSTLAALSATGSLAGAVGPGVAPGRLGSALRGSATLVPAMVADDGARRSAVGVSARGSATPSAAPLSCAELSIPLGSGRTTLSPRLDAAVATESSPDDTHEAAIAQHDTSPTRQPRASRVRQHRCARRRSRGSSGSSDASTEPAAPARAPDALVLPGTRSVRGAWDMARRVRRTAVVTSSPRPARTSAARIGSLARTDRFG